MTFQLPDKYENTAAALRELEPQAPKQIKALMLQAAAKLDAYRELCQVGAKDLEHAASLRIGMMDSQSRADEISRNVRTTMSELARKMRAI